MPAQGEVSQSEGRWCYLYRRSLVDLTLNETRDMEATKAFFHNAKAVTHDAPVPERLTRTALGNAQTVIQRYLTGLND